MKAIKRFAGIMLALVMLLTMTVTTSFADPVKGTITIENPPSGNTYEAYKIFDVSYSGTNYAYSIDTSSEWFGVVENYVNSGSKGLTLQEVKDTTKYNITFNEGLFSASDFVKHLRDNIPAAAGGESFTKSGDNLVASNLDLGYYFINNSGATGGLCALTTTNPEATVQPKNEITFTKTDNKESVQVGEKVNYEINTIWPDASQFDTYDFVLSDEMSEGLTYNDDMSITIGGTEVTKANWDQYFTYELTKSGDRNNGFKMTFKIKENNVTPKATIVLNYTATANEAAVASIEKNNAKLVYSNNPQNAAEKKTLTDEETVYSAKVVVNKHADSESGPALAGAEFVLRQQDSDSNVYYYQYDEHNQVVSWTKDLAQATKLVTGSNGTVEFKGLKNGSYRLQEIKAPDGYRLPDTMTSITINGTNALAANNEAALIYSVNIVNNSGTMLPGTGGMGTTIFYVLGAILVLGAGVLLINRRRMNAGK